MRQKPACRLSAITPWTLSLILTLLSLTPVTPVHAQHVFNGSYRGPNTGRIAFPVGGMGAGMFCLEGSGAISHMSVRNNPDMFNEPPMFAAIAIKGRPGSARVLEGPVPGWKKFGMPNAATGGYGSTWGLARFRSADFLARFPFGEINLYDEQLPLSVHISGWSPFIPTDADNSSLPVGALEYSIRNTGNQPIDLVFSYNTRNFMALDGAANHIKPIRQGFVLCQDSATGHPEQRGDFAIFTDDPATIVDHAWFRGAWFDPVSMAWNHIEKAETISTPPLEKDAPGASLFVPFTLKPGQQKTIRLMMAWYVPDTKMRFGWSAPAANAADSSVIDRSTNLPSPFHKPWYSSKFRDIAEVADYWMRSYDKLRRNSNFFKDAFYKSTLPPEVTEAVAANLTILKSPTVLRQYDGRFWGWEGSNDTQGSCPGSCTHVWNYAQALSHLFPALERSLRETEFGEDQSTEGYQCFRAIIPIRPVAHTFYPASDGQLGGIMKVYRDWRISGDSIWLGGLYPKVKKSMDFCIRTWDPRHTGTIEEPHHNTYDIEFWGADAMITSFYLGALESFIRISQYLHQDCSVYLSLFEKGKKAMEGTLYNGQYFDQHIQWTGLSAGNPVEAARQSIGGGYSPEAIDLLQREGPKYQYGKGCLSDGVLGAWMARVCGLPSPVDGKKIGSHLLSVYQYNYKQDLSGFSNPQRPTYALGREGGLLLCTWPKGGKPSLPFVYSNEVWTGIEYQVASHLIFEGERQKGLTIVRTARQRYDGIIRNPFDEYECGHWYARAMSSYALIEALTGVRYDAVEKTLYVRPQAADFTSFLSTATGFGNVRYHSGKAIVQVAYGAIAVERIVYE